MRIRQIHFFFVLYLTLSNITVNAQNFKQTGLASFYADKFEGRQTANGEKYRHSKLTAAHKTLPFGTILKVTNLENDKTVEVRINDRGPFIKGRIIDLSKSAATELEFIQKGIVKVEITTISNPEESRSTYSSLDRPVDLSEKPDKEYYNLNVQRLTPEGYGIQIGSFAEMVNLVELSSSINRSFSDKLFVQVAVIQGVKYYKLIIGNLKTVRKANKLKTKVLRHYPDCFVIKF